MLTLSCCLLACCRCRHQHAVAQAWYVALFCPNQLEASVPHPCGRMCIVRWHTALSPENQSCNPPDAWACAQLASIYKRTHVPVSFEFTLSLSLCLHCCCKPAQRTCRVHVHMHTMLSPGLRGPKHTDTHGLYETGQCPRHATPVDRRLAPSRRCTSSSCLRFPCTFSSNYAAT